MKILVTGDRHWTNLDSIANALVDILEEYNIDPTKCILIHGNARGADKLAGVCGECLKMDVRPYPAHWGHTDDCPEGCREMCGRPAGAIRNKKMLDENPDIDLALAFHPDLEGGSKGTKDMVKRLEKAGKLVRRFDK